MEIKKNPRKDLERFRSMFLNIGFVASLCVVITAFEWRVPYTMSEIAFDESIDDLEIVEIAPTVHKIPLPPPKPIPIIRETDAEIEEKAVTIDIDFDESFIIEDIPEVPEIEDEEVPEHFVIVEQMPTPKGGMKSFFKYLGKNMRYPNQARRMGVEGKVFVQFMVNTDGSLSQLEVVKGIGAGCDEEAIRVMRGAPKWNPGKQRGKPVMVRMILPIHFRLQ